LIDEQIDATTRAVTGLTVACARCHDHKFDPITQREYYGLAGIFRSTQTFYGTGGGDAKKNRNGSPLLPLHAALKADASPWSLLHKAAWLRVCRPMLMRCWRKPRREIRSG
jgi:hypothetical protein